MQRDEPPTDTRERPRGEAPLTLNAWLRWDVVRQRVREIRPTSILELGVGGGAVGARLAQLAPTYVGFEPDETSRALATSRMPDGATVVGDESEIGDRRFDLVCAFEVIEHLEDDRAALEAWAGWLEPGGWLLLSTPAFASRYGSWDARVGHHRRYDPSQMEALLADVGLTSVEVVAVGFPLGYLLETARNAVARRRPATSTAEVRTAGSGRLYQPRAGGRATELLTAPFRAVQRRFPDRGTTLVAVARRRA